MTYLNPVRASGLGAFADLASTAGVDGVIIPDLSFEESDGLAATFSAHGIDAIQLVAPSTPPERAQATPLASRGFLSVVARYGTTGVRTSLPEDLTSRLAALKKATSIPLAVGFGVSTPEHVRVLRDGGADGVVVGSAIVRRTDPSPAPGTPGRSCWSRAATFQTPGLPGSNS